VVIPGLLDGMASINRLTQKWLAHRRPWRLHLRARGHA
jgi:hypothetical protein